MRSAVGDFVEGLPDDEVMKGEQDEHLKKRKVSN